MQLCSHNLISSSDNLIVLLVSQVFIFELSVYSYLFCPLLVISQCCNTHEMMPSCLIDFHVHFWIQLLHNYGIRHYQQERRMMSRPEYESGGWIHPFGTQKHLSTAAPDTVTWGLSRSFWKLCNSSVMVESLHCRTVNPVCIFQPTFLQLYSWAEHACFLWKKLNLPVSSWGFLVLLPNFCQGCDLLPLLFCFKTWWVSILCNGILIRRMQCLCFSSQDG